MQKIIEPIFKIDVSGVTTYDYRKKEDMIRLINNVRNGYRIYKFIKLAVFLL